MKKKVLILGASGALGLEILKEANKKNFSIRALTHSEEGYNTIKAFTKDIWFGDASNAPTQLRGITNGVDYVISAMGKSVSLFNPTPNSFYQNNYKANYHVLQDAIDNQVDHFFYVSMKGADKASKFTIPETHRMMEQEIRKSNLKYSIIRPVGFFSGLNDLIIMAKRQIIPLVGDAQAKTNSIHQVDLAQFILDTFLNLPDCIEVGGPKVHTREDMAKMIQKKIGGKIIKFPESMAHFGSQFSKLISKKQLGHKLEYFSYIMSHDMIGEKHGEISFETYLNQINTEDIK